MDFKYADQEEQLKRANRFLVSGYLIFYAILMIIMWACYFVGIRSKGLTMMVSGIVLVSCIAIFACCLLCDRICLYTGIYPVAWNLPFGRMYAFL